MSHAVTVSIPGCLALHRLEKYLEIREAELTDEKNDYLGHVPPDIIADLEMVGNGIKVIESILYQAVEDGWSPPS